MHKVMSDTEVKTYIKDLRRKKFNKRTEFADWLISPFISDNPNQSIREVAIRVACVVRADINDVIAALAREAGWDVLPDGTTFPSRSQVLISQVQSLCLIRYINVSDN